MAIIRVRTGNMNSEDACENGAFPLYDRSRKIKRINTYTFKGEYIIIPGEGLTFTPKYINGKFGLHQRAYAITSTHVNVKYLFFVLLKSNHLFLKHAQGSTVPSLRSHSFNWINKLDFPSMEDQEEIIDIIEPLEKVIDAIELLKKRINKLRNLLEKLGMFKPIENMNIHCDFIKGGTTKVEKGTIPFLNVAAANNKINRYVGDEPNVIYGDIMLTLDGTCGIVNNNLYGFNGYLYKVTSSKYENYEIYFSLLSKSNQNIISDFAFGTTIKHASGAKKHLKLLNIPRHFSSIYNNLLIGDKLLIDLEAIKNKMLKILITTL